LAAQIEADLLAEEIEHVLAMDKFDFQTTIPCS
jgi:hypothetical protein